MEDIKFKVKCKNVDGSIEQSDVELKPNGEYSAENTVEPSPTAGVADVKVDGNSVVENGTVNLVTKTAYDAETNKIATEADCGGGSASFEVLSQCTLEYDSVADETTITFPNKIVPLAFYFECIGDILYFDYTGGQLLDNVGNYYGDVILTGIYSGEGVKIILSGESYWTPSEDNLQFILFDGSSFIDSLNALNIYFPQNYPYLPKPWDSHISSTEGTGQIKFNSGDAVKIESCKLLWLDVEVEPSSDHIFQGYVSIRPYPEEPYFIGYSDITGNPTSIIFRKLQQGQIVIDECGSSIETPYIIHCVPIC